MPRHSARFGAALPAVGILEGAEVIDDFVLDLVVDGDGLVSGRAERADTTEGAVTGAVLPQPNGSWTVELTVTEGNQVSTFSGSMDGDRAKGRVYRAGRSEGRWALRR